MALTLEAEQRLQSVNLVDFFTTHQAAWLQDARETYEFLARNFPQGVTIRPDDVAKPLRPIIEVDQRLRAELARKKLGRTWSKKRLMNSSVLSVMVRYRACPLRR
jgi:hypothetical protein